jgi:hypothetical protein
MENHDERVPDTYVPQPGFKNFSVGTLLKLRMRLMDDGILITNRHIFDHFVEHMNSIDPRIQFTVDKEVNGVLNFLDLRIQRNTDGTMTTSVYRKATHTDQYNHWSSNALGHWLENWQ